QDMDFSEDPKSTFYAQALEVKNVGDKLTKEQKDIATFWVDTPGITGTPGGHWVALTAQLIGDLKLDLGRSVDALAMVGIGVGDAFISGWNIKYVVLLMRPETYIHKYIDAKWQPFIQTPPFPEFVSGHSIVSETAARILTDIFGTMSFTDNTERFRNLDSRSFTSFENAASEAGISRLYGGIHYRTGIEKGFDEGRCVAASIIDRIKVR
ncbi:MAG: vanadium-dependent haloperoxidase, partial [Anaerolineae bacterium]|nr:vanadium-dependent haloperoxidase [Anaerolineae bacterium]